MNLLSKRESEIVYGVAQGLTNREIAKQFGLSPHTVKNCLFRVFDKLGVSNRVELLLMTMSGDRDAQSALQYLFENRGNVGFQDEATFVACHRAADQGVLMAQLALAKFYSANRTSPNESPDLRLVLDRHATNFAGMGSHHGSHDRRPGA